MNELIITVSNHPIAGVVVVAAVLCAMIITAITIETVICNLVQMCVTLAKTKDK